MSEKDTLDDLCNFFNKRMNDMFTIDEYLMNMSAFFKISDDYVAKSTLILTLIDLYLNQCPEFFQSLKKFIIKTERKKGKKAEE